MGRKLLKNRIEIGNATALFLKQVVEIDRTGHIYHTPSDIVHVITDPKKRYVIEVYELPSDEKWETCTSDNTKVGDRVRHKAGSFGDRIVKYVYKNGVHVVLEDTSGSDFLGVLNNYLIDINHT